MKTDIKKEIEYIIKRAYQCDGRVVRLGGLILFSTETGDAWILDKDDQLAICLVKDGEKQKYRLIDTPTQFGFDWECKYFIESDFFITIDEQGNQKRIFGYPVKQLQNK